MADLIEEVDEDLRRERLISFWRKCGSYVMAGSALIVLGTVAVVLWENHRHTISERDTASLLAAQHQLAGNKPKEVANTLKEAETSSQDYAALAVMAEAQASAKQGEWEKAAASYDRVADMESSSSALHDMALLLAAYSRLQQNKDWKAFDTALKPLREEGRPFAATAKEMAAMAAYAQKDNVATAGMLQELAGDINAPATLRARAGELQSYLTPQAIKAKPQN